MKEQLEIFKEPIVASFTIAFILTLILQPISIGFIVGTSMEPNYSQGDLVIATSFEDPEVGEVVFFNRPSDNINIVHRVVSKKSENKYITKGDNNKINDGVVREKYIQGVEILHLRTSSLENELLPSFILVILSGSLYLIFSLILYIPVKIIQLSIKDNKEYIDELKSETFK